ncbi:MAG TPA: MOSC N-terminal beta barrel domain-containing protein [Candidatus Methylomirabilis sp.]|nr:MOSC N-terminal beta barrel domain-containing protein [Candidatus Methylomirabilis sp.]
MQSRPLIPRLANIRLHPIKALDPVFANEARIGPNGGLELDRAWALYSSDGRWVNGKRTPAMHLIRAEYGPDLNAVTLSIPGDRRNIPAMTFAFPSDTDGAALWFSTYFEQNIVVHYAREGFPDDGLASGPTIVSRESLEAVCAWFPGLPLEEARRRFRTTLEISGGASPDGNGSPSADEPSTRAAGGLNGKLPAFWEDQLFAEDDTRVVRFRIGDVAFEGSNPCARCPVPSRDSYTGAAVDGFQKRFSELRQAQLPAWAPVSRFDHFYRLATNTRVPSTEHGKLLRVGDALSLQ